MTMLFENRLALNLSLNRLVHLSPSPHDEGVGRGAARSIGSKAPPLPSPLLHCAEEREWIACDGSWSQGALREVRMPLVNRVAKSLQGAMANTLGERDSFPECASPLALSNDWRYAQRQRTATLSAPAGLAR
jgi:hypothetical protein